MPTEDPKTNRIELIEQMLDSALAQVAKQISDGTVSASLLREVVAIATTAGINLAESGQVTSTSFDPILESMKDLDIDLLQN